MNILLTISIFLMLNYSFEIELQPKQREGFNIIERPECQYFGFGGAKFGGKSYLVRASQIIRRLKYAGTVGCIFRESFPQLMSNHIRKLFFEFPKIHNWYRAGEKSIHFPNGSILDFRHLDTTKDVFNYIGIEYDDIVIDQAEQHEEVVFKILKTCLRMDPRIKKMHPNYNPKVFLTFNPGGIGHGYVKRLFIDREFEPNETPEDYDFIWAKYYDNPIGVKANPQYLRNLMDLPEELRRAYLEGDFDIFAGQYFKKLRRDRHLIEPFSIPDGWLHFRSMDWGYDRNTVVLWWAVDFEGNCYIYRHYKKNEIVASKVAQKIVEMTPESEEVILTVAGHDCWERIKHDETPMYTTMADVFNVNGLYIERANIDRVPGWGKLRELIEWNGRKPKLFIFSTCEEVYKDLAKLIHDEDKPEDVKKMLGDDVGDAARYGAAHIFATVKPEIEKSPTERLIERITVPEPEEKKWGSDL